METDERTLTRCPDCGGGRLEYRNHRHWVCPDCGLDLYNNVAAACGMVFYTEDGHILFERRAKNPGKGKLGFPGGFIDPDETVEEACVRECLEETGLTLNPDRLEYLMNRPNTYSYKGITYKTCDLFFACQLNDDQLKQLKAQETEVAEFLLMKVDTPEEAEKLPFAFESSRIALMTYLKRKQ